mmetsp:Transcript_29342/g.39873  ORF Transcript_29342/g.39873 Transcript_29342/m.39873 type:complete len:317 (-) Transcript_29342:1229-2179(-)
MAGQWTNSFAAVTSPFFPAPPANLTRIDPVSFPFKVASAPESSVKAALSTENVSSCGSAKTFRIGSSFVSPAFTSNGPRGCGRRHVPARVHRYSPQVPPPGDESVITSVSCTAPIRSGSKRILTEKDCPSQSGVAGMVSCGGTSKNWGLDTLHVKVAGSLLKTVKVKVSSWKPPSGVSKRRVGDEVGGRARRVRSYLYTPSSLARNTSFALVGGSEGGGTTRGRYSIWKLPSGWPWMSPSFTRFTSGWSHSHQSSAKVTGVPRGRGLSTVTRRLEVCRTGLSISSVSMVLGSVTTTLIRCRRYSPVSGLRKVTAAE